MQVSIAAHSEETLLGDQESEAARTRTQASKSGTRPDWQEVTAACPASVSPAGASVWLDFTHIKTQLPLSRVLDHLGLTPRLKGADPQRRCACPIHRGDGRGRTFSVNLDRNQYQCFETRCQSQGDVIDLWAALHRMTVRDAALDLVRTFGLEPSPATQRRGTVEERLAGTIAEHR